MSKMFISLGLGPWEIRGLQGVWGFGSRNVGPQDLHWECHGPEMCELRLPRYGEPVLSLCPRCGSPSFTQGNRREISLNLQPMDSLQVISETEEFLEGDLGL